MTRKDYELIAAELAALHEDQPTMEVTRTTIANVARQLAIGLGRDNGRFDPNRFLLACGVNLDD